MSKKFGKFILAAAAVTTAAAAACYFIRKDKSITIDSPDEDFDDFSDESVDDEERSYVELNHQTGASENEEKAAKEPVTFTSLTNQIKKTAGRVVGRTIEAVEEFFDDEDKDSAETAEKASEDAAEENSADAVKDAASAKTEEDTAEAAKEAVSVKIEEDIVDAVKAGAEEKPAEEADSADPAVQIEVDTVRAVQADAAEETEVFLDEEDETDGENQ